MGFTKPIEQYLCSNLLIEIQVFMYLKDIIRGRKPNEADGRKTGCDRTSENAGSDEMGLFDK